MPRFPFRRMRHAARLVALKTLAQIVYQPGIESALVNVALEDIDVVQ
jgi:hypothetical protein